MSSFDDNYKVLLCDDNQRRMVIDFIRSNHYSKSISRSSSPVFMLQDKRYRKLIGGIAFHHPSSENVVNSVYGGKYTKSIKELHKLYIIDDTPKNMESYFIAKVMKKMKTVRPDIHTIISYADSTEGHTGAIYKASNFFYCGLQESKSVFYRNPITNKLIHPRQCGVNISRKEAISNGWLIEKRRGKHRFVLINAPSRKRKYLINELQWEVM